MALGNAATLDECAKTGDVRRRTRVDAAGHNGVERTIGACFRILERVFVRSQAKSQCHPFVFASLICLQGPHHDPPLDILDRPGAQRGSAHIREYTNGQNVDFIVFWLLRGVLNNLNC